jgi:hypothetical protein
VIFLAVRIESTIVCFVCRFSSCVRRGWEENHFISAMTERVTLSNDLLLSEVALMLSEGCTVTLLAKGSSMFPFIIGGCDRVVLQKTDRIQVGDIVLAYLTGRSYVLHRIYRIADDDIILMGDSNVSEIERCRRENICGKVLRIMHSGKHIECSSLKERCKVRIWMALLPFRKYILGVCRYWYK